MWKLILGFIAFAAIAMFVIIKGGSSLDMGGEKHGAEAVSAPEHAASAASAPADPASAAAPAASAASK